MIGQSITFTLTSNGIAEGKTSQLRQEYQANQQWFQAQTAAVQRFLTVQAASLAEAVIQGEAQAHFSLPDQILCPGNPTETKMLPAAKQKQIIGGFWDRLTKTGLQIALSQRLAELERSPDPAVSVATGFLRYAISGYMISELLPSGRSVAYAIPDDDDIPNQPLVTKFTPVVRDRPSPHSQNTGTGRNPESLDTAGPDEKAALDFFMPQWVAFDTHGNLLVRDIPDAEACLASMQHYLAILDTAITIAPYRVADDIYLQKRYGIQGQLVNQGRALAHYQAQAMIGTIKKRASEHKLDRGLKLRVPYFDDRKFKIDSYDFMIIPAGWIMFTPAFAVLASREQQFKVAQEKTLSFATRKHLFAELHELELAFMR
jgi:hypothetical protein